MGKAIEDMRGLIFGRLIVLSMEKVPTNKRDKVINITYCKCRCECGNEKLILPNNLRSGRTKSCGCLESESRYTRKHFIDITGNVYGKLTTIKKLDKLAGNGSPYWLCKCSCGNFTEVTFGNLNRKTGATTSCGCNVREYFATTIPNYINKRFGKLIVLELVNERTRKGRCVWKCLCDCGNISYVKTSDLTMGNTKSCGLCICSHGELLVKELLDKYGINYIQQKRFDDCILHKKLSFDFYLPDLNTAIEYDGKQHFVPVDHFGGENGFKKTKERDQYKNHYCEIKNIKLIRLPYNLSSKEIENEIINIKNP